MHALDLIYHLVTRTSAKTFALLTGGGAIRAVEAIQSTSKAGFLVFCQETVRCECLQQRIE